MNLSELAAYIAIVEVSQRGWSAEVNEARHREYARAAPHERRATLADRLAAFANQPVWWVRPGLSPRLSIG